MTTRQLHISPALPEPGDPHWGRCPHCKQSAEAQHLGKLTCSRCGWMEGKGKPSPFTTK